MRKLIVILLMLFFGGNVWAEIYFAEIERISYDYNKDYKPCAVIFYVVLYKRELNLFPMAEASWKLPLVENWTIEDYRKELEYNIKDWINETIKVIKKSREKEEYLQELRTLVGERICPVLGFIGKKNE